MLITNLKDAFRYQNFLTTLLNQANDQLMCRDNLLTVTKTHKLKDANPEAENVTEIVDVKDPASPKALIALQADAIRVHEDLSKAISAAKASYVIDGEHFDIDAALETVKSQRSAAGTLKRVLNIKGGTSQTRGTAYKFNAEGNQTPYTYDVEVTSQENFDREDVKKRVKALLQGADELSASIEKAMVECTVGYDAKFDINDTFEDILAGYDEK